jgi:hypothetical protein
MTTRERNKRLRRERERLKRAGVNGPSQDMYWLCAGIKPRPPILDDVRRLRNVLVAADPRFVRPNRAYARVVLASFGLELANALRRGDPRPFRELADAIEAANRWDLKPQHDGKPDALRDAFLSARDYYYSTLHPDADPEEAPNLDEIRRVMEQILGRNFGEHGARIVRKIARSLGIKPGKAGRPSRKRPTEPPPLV